MKKDKKALKVEIKWVPISKEEAERRRKRLSELLIEGAIRASKDDEQNDGK